MAKVCNWIIRYSFYGLFLLVPLAFTSATSELFELNKMWLTWILTIIIGMAWFAKMVLQRKFIFQRTPLDIPIGLFLLSQIISTIFSLDSHVSFWGYYSRFNGGLFSTISYILLYYAFLSNFQINAVAMVKRSLFLSLISGLIVALWGLPSHFGYDPTCLLFRGTFDVSCWTADFMPRVKIFSTLGQPSWLAAYLAILIPISITMFISSFRNHAKIDGKIEDRKWKMELLEKIYLPSTFYFLLSILFYVDLLYTRARSGFLGIWIALIFFAATYFWFERKKIKSFFSIETLRSPLIIVLLGILMTTFIIGVPISQLNGLTLEGIGRSIQKIQAPKASTKAVSTPTPVQSVQSFESGGGGTESGDIRRYVWAGAINTWKANPIFGTGVETFAFAYYKYKPAGQNLTSEWNFLYNKAHNEYLNYLATTGIFGLGSYLLMIGSFLFLGLKQFKSQNVKVKIATQNSKSEKYTDENYALDAKRYTLVLALLASYISILVTNFFGFSVVIINIYLLMIPAFIFVLADMVKPNLPAQSAQESVGIENPVWQWTPIFFILLACLFSLIALFRFWQADVAFALGFNLDRAGEYQQAYPHLHKAVQLRGGEPVFKDELSLNDAIIAAGLVSQKSEDPSTKEQIINTASSLAQEAINVSNEIISQHPNNAVFWKTRVKLFFTLSQVDSRYLPRALDAIEKASLLAPNDANIWYNLGVLYGQNSYLEKGISAMEKTVILKPDYRDAHYALGLFYDQAGQKEKAIFQMQYILDHISPKDKDALKSIEDWKLDK